MSSRIVVVGGGTAGARLAERLPVTLLGEEPHAPYNRVLLADVLAGRYGPEVIALPAPRDGGARHGVRVTGVDRAARVVHCADGEAFAYDRLVLATGSNPVLPPLRGLGGGRLPAGVHAFRTLDDCLALDALVAPGVRAVVIGGGLLGVSATRALAARGAEVVLAQQGEHLMERQLDAEAARLLRRHLEADLGVEVHTECRVRGLRCVDDTVEAVELADGFVLDADVVVIACGVRPRIGLALEAGLDVRRGIVVDDQLRTSDPYIHAIGDCAEHDGRLYGLAGAALEQADALADVLLHGTGAYRGTRALTRLSMDALELAAFGEATPLPGDDTVRLADATSGAYRKVVVRGDRLVGGVLLGDLGAVGALARAWEGDEALPEAPLLHLLTHDGGS
ncbi:NAD(P)/FAD-dependent oxidoreductase [Streptomyces sp. WAC05374]|uniref:NAD(P)/FAD-dependent oxidoreductase n=1 Tax=Streptomyces sp. WAC05374 TaxID=2487420 RepID=UPI000F885FB3|nr:FAD-dependent oxidoreductase [Streptomyces sp. WAC05374]RST10040.1 NAD(P)/FAD-dependent oxidoreductase [Streptomyces sp. WAC05374]TDF45258.1 NAD(P)/FAD-dependent oxidoreductase [Streptomyces sp. WAC05374]TDF55754.1 NAD(P)/FAD-dependent oxidoreductase [Streptomyces sp. WAC05374]TDF58892.1 NAD(P)/FAD-dependent oxidoreductase [Streptomyces sp. WAC05374]